MKMFNRKLALVPALAIAGVMATSSLLVAQAADFVVPKDNGNVTVSADEKHDDLYVLGGNVLVNSGSTGDLVVAGGNVTIEGNVVGDVLIAGGTVYINGAIEGDVRGVGGSVTINNKVGGDVVMAGGTIVINERAEIGGDVMLAGGEISLLGRMMGSKLQVHGERVTINNVVTGNAQIKVTDKLFLGSKTVLGNTAIYKSYQEAQVENGAQLGGLQFEKFTGHGQDGKDRAGFVAGVLTLGFVLKLLASIVTALVLQKLFRRISHNLVQHLAGNFWMDLLIGLVAVIVTPIIAVLLMLSVVGFYLALILLAVWVLFLLVSCLLGTVFIGAWLVKKLGKKSELIIDWQAIVIGVVVVGIVSLIPIVGMLLVVVLMLAAMGALVRKLHVAIKSNQDGQGSVE